MAEKPQPPPLVYVAAPCPDCGARNMDEAETMCRPTSDETGERSCGGEFNSAGISVQPTAASLKAWDNFFCAASSGI